MAKDEITKQTQMDKPESADLPELIEDERSELDLFKERWGLTDEDIEARRNEAINYMTWSFRSDPAGHGSDSTLLRRDAAAAQDLYQRLAPTDPIEEMLVQEIIMAHQTSKQLMVSAARSDRTREQKFELSKEAARFLKLSRDLMRELDRHRMQKLKSQTEVQRQDALDQKRDTETLKQQKLLLEIERMRADADKVEQNSGQWVGESDFSNSEDPLATAILKQARAR
ncbi:MAG: hypothetical protein JJ872_01550 [Marivivens sp.]|nr:hypothetical protein [Marivivens sp.]